MKGSVNRLVAVGVLFLSSAGTVRSQRQGGPPPELVNVATYGVGASSCGTWLDAREGAKKDRYDVRHIQFEAYAHGFASAYNSYVHEVPDILGSTDQLGLWAYLDKYCREDPTKTFAAAVASLIQHLKSTQSIGRGRS